MRYLDKNYPNYFAENIPSFSKYGALFML